MLSSSRMAGIFYQGCKRQQSNAILINRGNGYLTRNQVFGLMTPMEGDQQGLLKGRWNQSKHHKNRCICGAILSVQKTACKHLGVQLETYDDNKEAKSVCVYVHVMQGDSKEDTGMHMTATDRLDRADEVQSIISGLQFFRHFCVPR